MQDYPSSVDQYLGCRLTHDPSNQNLGLALVVYRCNHHQLLRVSSRLQVAYPLGSLVLTSQFSKSLFLAKPVMVIPYVTLPSVILLFVAIPYESLFLDKDHW